MDVRFQLTQVLVIWLQGVMGTVGYITSLLFHYNALTTITALVLMSILVSRLIGKHINTSGSSDRVRRKKDG